MSVAGWEVWRLPRPGAAFVLAVVLLPVLVLPLLLVAEQPAWHLADLGALVVLCLIATGTIEASRRVGMPAQVQGHPYPDLVSVWLFAAALLLPPQYVVLAALVLVPLLVRGVLPATYRRAFNIASLVLSGLAGHELLRWIGRIDTLHGIAELHGARQQWALVAALAGYVVVNVALVAVAIALIEPGVGLRQAFGGSGTLVTDLTALALGLLAALAWTVAPVLVLAVVPPVILLQRALIHDELRAAAQTDGRTGLATAVHWTGLARRSLERAAVTHASCALLVIDIDHFKTVNDTWGHLVGDDALTRVADTLRGSVRPGDVTGRLGGDEFAVLLPDTGLAEATRVAERLRASVAGAEVRVPGGARRGPLHVTVSVGVASTHESGYLVQDLTAAADAALYRAKAAGRDQVASPADPLVLTRPRSPVD